MATGHTIKIGITSTPYCNAYLRPTSKPGLEVETLFPLVRVVFARLRRIFIRHGDMDVIAADLRSGCLGLFLELAPMGIINISSFR
jgi:hypothetical protein